MSPYPIIDHDGPGRIYGDTHLSVIAGQGLAEQEQRERADNLTRDADTIRAELAKAERVRADMEQTVRECLATLRTACDHAADARRQVVSLRRELRHATGSREFPGGAS